MSELGEFPTFSVLVAAMRARGVQRGFAKRLAPNDNSKNQIYLSGSFHTLQVLPVTEITTDRSRKDSKRDRYKAKLDFFWLSPDGGLFEAPRSQLILYPKYPEVRLSGFLKGAKKAPVAALTSRDEGRILFLGVTDDATVIGHVASAGTPLANEAAHTLGLVSGQGLEPILGFSGSPDATSRAVLIESLREIHEQGWVSGRRLLADGRTIPYKAPSAAGYTLEALLGIRPNADNAPDFHGWELKQHRAPLDNPLGGGPVTLIDTTPSKGIFAESRAAGFIRKYGYPDKSGIEDRLNFGGVHKAGIKQSLTGLTLVVRGFDPASGKITDVGGAIELIDEAGELAGGWPFPTLLKKWNRKHDRAAYVPCEKEMRSGQVGYRFGFVIGLGVGTSFDLLLKSVATTSTYYDPGMKIEAVSTGRSKQKVRSLFRIRARDLPRLYRQFDQVSVVGN
nr:MvaI/BcnI family restriction endonuclease [Nitrosomonas nitrosa]